MFKYKFVGRLGLFLSIPFLAAACAGGEIGDAPGGARLGPGYNDTNATSGPVGSGTPAALVCLGASPDVSASNGWRSSNASLPASGSLYFEFKARPAAANLDGLIGVGAEDITDVTKAAIAVRFAEDGLVDARDGSFYSSDVSYAYDPGVWYNVAISVDISTETYDVAIGPCGEPRETLIKDASFRHDANVRDQLSTWAVWSSQAAALDVSTPTWMASGGCAPATCQSLGHECGQPSDGCNGSLNCGGCESGDVCASGLCVDNSTPPVEPTPPPVEPTPPPVEPTPPPVEPTPPPPTEGQPERPWAHNTGYLAGSLTSYSGPSTITQDGATYEGFSTGSQITIDADNVTLRNFLITGGRYGIQIKPGHSGIVIEDGEIRNATSAGVLGVGFTGRRLYLHEMGGDAMKTQGTGGPTLVEYSFMEKIGTNVDSHADCNQISTYGSNITFRYNNCWIPTPTVSPYHSNAAFMNGSSSSISNYVIEHNWLNGGNYTIYGRPGISVRNNIFGGDYRYGIKSGSFSEWSGNRMEDTGDPI